MNRILKLNQLCAKIGILNQNELGPYGNFLLNRIKSFWLARNVHKYDNHYLVESVDFTKKPNDLNFTSPLGGSKTFPLGIINVFDGEYSGTFTNRLIKRSSETNLTAYYYNEVNSTRLSDPLVDWQNERMNWWSKLLNSPENLSIESPPQSSESNIVYKRDEDNLNMVIDSITFTPGHVAWGKKLDLVRTRTTAETIMEVALIDSFDDSADRAELRDKFNLNLKHKVRLNLNYSICPFKLCIIYDEKAASVRAMAHDLKSLLFAGHIHGVLVEHIADNPTELEAKYDQLDQAGVPYAVYLPSSVTKDGICFVRNRDTSLSEKTHVSLVFKQFKAISDTAEF